LPRGRSLGLESTDFILQCALSGAADLEQSLRHEATHVYLRRQLPRSAYRDIPRWLQEGLAIHFAGQTTARLADLLFKEPQAPEKRIAGLDAKESINQYFEYGSAIELIDEFPGGIDDGFHHTLAV
jgi:hypothetical protein